MFSGFDSLTQEDLIHIQTALHVFRKEINNCTNLSNKEYLIQTNEKLLSRLNLSSYSVQGVG